MMGQNVYELLTLVLGTTNHDVFLVSINKVSKQVEELRPILF